MKTYIKSEILIEEKNKSNIIIFKFNQIMLVEGQLIVRGSIFSFQFE